MARGILYQFLESRFEHVYLLLVPKAHNKKPDAVTCSSPQTPSVLRTSNMLIINAIPMHFLFL